MGNNVPLDAPLFRSDEGVSLLGGGQIGPDDLAFALARAPRLVAADGGAGAALAEGCMPEAVYGDLDSLAPSTRQMLPPEHVHEIAEQDSTDFDKALRHISAPFTLALGFTGARIDHELAAYHTLLQRPAARCIILGSQDIVFHAPQELRLDLPEGTRVSLFAMQSVRAWATGLVWPQSWPEEGLEFHPVRKIGTSNTARVGPVELRFDGPGMLLILPRTALDDAIVALREAAV